MRKTIRFHACQAVLYAQKIDFNAGCKISVRAADFSANVVQLRIRVYKKVKPVIRKTVAVEVQKDIKKKRVHKRHYPLAMSTFTASCVSYKYFNA